ncbi:Holliday junction ATP-dependent DNA helicase RuvB [Paraliobacillus ryukyuensis]|uniref:SpoVK/Ycf46/Vps4 family AAA+-type ATPase n=1 Tax=Paraliobacillus ryukyuensis TaxID=200904 RepID=A0A366EJU2_9BACI|nr:AAA family ATPase [Paraliobacillus ryukyuensis]RBP01695.1 SpoVK/Ycf46/Vps4 family AAA+-type ATPase [Paraliobacillus ryukyuensis]
MSEVANTQTINEDKITNWKSLDQLPPLTEVEILRVLDDVEKEKQTVANETMALLYTMLAFHRLKRHTETDPFVDFLLRKAGDYDATIPVYQSIQQIKSYYQFYLALSEQQFEEWALRETDFAPVKLKKMNQWVERLQNLLDSTTIESSNDLEIGRLYKKIIQQINDLIETLEDAIAMLENKRTSAPISKINNDIRALSSLKIDLYHSIPMILQSNENKTALDKLQEMVGLADIKDYMNKYYHYLKYQKERKELGFQMIDEPGLHMVITGNPGTGKTTIARLLAEIYYELGLLQSKEVIEVNRSHLVGSYVGQSEENTIAYIKKAMGGILFIDEAYSLKRQEQQGNDYGQAVIDTLVSAMTSSEYEGKFAVILAGYPEEMRQFLWSNPGLRSRFPDQNFISLPDFQINELLHIAENTALSNDYFFTTEARRHFETLIDQAKVDETFGNARTVRDLVLKAIFNKGAAETIDVNDNWIEHMRIDKEDLDFIDNQSDGGDPMEQLDDLIGLSNVKQEVKKLSSFVKVQQQRKQQGYPAVPIQLHAVFSGNSGTGKTTVAKIYSELLKDCGLLKRGHFVIASRSDLVAGYVGQTAVKTKQKIREALGGVLFIDEAYSLFRGQNDFGKEAIDTLVDEMTKHNENLVVILAGYKQEMQQFIDSNPGLASRFKKYFHFLDYNADELIQITNYHVKNYQYQLDGDAASYLFTQFNNNKINGNARFVVNLVDEAIQFQALRLEDSEDSSENFLLLTKADVEKAWLAVKGENES